MQRAILIVQIGRRKCNEVSALRKIPLAVRQTYLLRAVETLHLSQNHPHPGIQIGRSVFFLKIFFAATKQRLRIPYLCRIHVPFRRRYLHDIARARFFRETVDLDKRPFRNAKRRRDFSQRLPLFYFIPLFIFQSQHTLLYVLPFENMLLLCHKRRRTARTIMV